MGLGLAIADEAVARPGGGSSFGGGGGSHGGSSSSSRSSGSSGGSSYRGSSSYRSSSGGGGGGGGGDIGPLGVVLVVAAFGLVTVVQVAVAAAKNGDGWFSAMGDWDPTNRDDSPGIVLPSAQPWPKARPTQVLLEPLRAHDPNLSQILLEDFLYELYTRAHEARSSKDDLALLAPYLDAGVRGQLASRGMRKVLAVSGVIVGAMQIIKLELRDGWAAIDVEYETNYTETYPSGTGKGDLGFYAKERWHFVRQLSAASRKPDETRGFGCPSCGAPVEQSHTDACSYCGTKHGTGDFDWLCNGIVLEREAGPHGQPRAFSCDDEALRIYQQIGLVEALRADMVACERVEYTGVGGRKFAQIDVGELEFGTGYAPLHFFYQPLLEQTLRGGLRRFPRVSLRLGHELTALRQDDEAVSVEVRVVATGEYQQLRARHLLACDGAHSPVRRLLEVALVGRRYDERWLAVSGLAGEDAVRVAHTRFVCDPARPAFVGKGPAGDFRMEFMLRPDETPEEMEKPETIRRLVAPFVDPARLEIRRAVVYRFGNAVADRWQVGRVLLLGDAAHQMPPFMGQGLVSGLRDVANVCWKLALVVTRGVDPGLLASYEQERRPHVRAMAEISVKMGHVFLAQSPTLARARDLLFRALDRVPRARKFIRGFEFKPGPSVEAGLIFGGRRRRGAAAGGYFPQPRVLTPAGFRARLDELLGPGFAVVGQAF